MEKHIERACEQARERGWAALDGRQAETLAELAHLLVKWNRRFNLTSITREAEIAELHILDSLALGPQLEAGERILDVGAGAGFPGLPLAIARPDTRWVLVDRTEKKVAFMKNAIASLGISNAEGRHLRLGGKGEEEGLEGFDVAVSRAFAAPERWLPFGASYVRPGGRVIAMLGGKAFEPEDLVGGLGLEAGSLDFSSYRLPSGAARGLLVWTTPA